MALEVSVDRPGRYVLELDRKAGAYSFVRMGALRGAVSAGQYVLPALDHTSYLLHSAEGSVRLLFDEGEVSSARLRRVQFRDLINSLERPRVIARLRLKVADGVTLRPLLRGAGRQGRGLVKALRLLTGWGFGLASQNLRSTPWLFSRIEAGGGGPRVAARRSSDRPRFVVVLHLFYPDLWPEFEFFLRRLRRPFHLIVTTTAATAAQLQARVNATFPSAEIVALPNRGRDVGPFLQLLHDGRLDGFEFVCKIHGKQTAPAGHRALLGHVWRRATLVDLLGSDEQVEGILDRFDSASAVGMIGSPRFRLPAEFMPSDVAWGANERLTLDVASRLGIAAEDFRLDYFAGTMFWARRDVLEPLRRLNLTLADFPDEDGRRDGHLHHAMERLLGALPGTVGMTLENAPIALRQTSSLGRSAFAEAGGAESDRGLLVEAPADRDGAS